MIKGKPQFRCEKCRRVPEYIRVNRYHALNCWEIEVRCHGQTERLTIKPPPLSAGAPFDVGDLEVFCT